MSVRANLLKAFGLSDRDAFEIEPCQDPHGQWRVKFAHPGDPARLFDIGGATKLSDAVRRIDPQLAQQIDESVEKAKRYS